MTETRNYYTTYNYTDHTKFGGLIYSSDFNTYYANGNIVNRIVADMKFDKQCRTNAENRNRAKLYA